MEASLARPVLPVHILPVGKNLAPHVLPVPIPHREAALARDATLDGIPAR